MTQNGSADSQVALWKFMAGILLAVLALSILACVYVVGVNQSLRSDIRMDQQRLTEQGRQLQSLLQVRQTASDCINNILLAHGNNPAIFAIIKQHFPDVRPPAAVEEPEAGMATPEVGTEALAE